MLSERFNSRTRRGVHYLLLSGRLTTYTHQIIEERTEARGDITPKCLHLMMFGGVALGALMEATKTLVLATMSRTLKMTQETRGCKRRNEKSLKGDVASLVRVCFSHVLSFPDCL
jgi:hypothetical protein